MKFMIVILLIASVLLLSASCGSITNVVHSVNGVEGTWKKKWTWKSKWVKSWTPKTVYIAKWTRVWTPAEIREYVPNSLLPLSDDHHHSHVKATSVHYR